MTDTPKLSNPLAVITGASSGLGKTYAEVLAAEGFDLLLVARREPLLLEIKAELESAHDVKVEIAKVDLADESQTISLADRLVNLDRIDLLINNAGFGAGRAFSNTEIQRQIDMVRVHVEAPMRLTRAVLPSMLKNGSGGIINVASVAGFLHGDEGAAYFSTKAALISFSRSLHAEVARHGLQVQALCPGFVYTGFHDTPEMSYFDRKIFPKFLWLQAKPIIRASLRRLRRNGGVVYIPTLRYKIITAFLRRPIGSLFLKKASKDAEEDEG